MRRILNISLAVALALGVTTGVSACSSSNPVAQVEITEQSIILDVRTAEEYAGGHLDGAMNVDWNSSFTTVMAGMPKDGEYLLYCRSGSRAGQAEAWMKANGFTNVVNLGAVAQAAEATGIAVVK